MNLKLSTAIALLASCVANADTILNRGLINQFDDSGGSYERLILGTSSLSFSWFGGVSLTPYLLPTCPDYHSSTVCTFNLSFTDTFNIFTPVTYNGITYANPYLVVVLTFVAPIGTVTSTYLPGGNPAFGYLATSFSGVPFTVAGAATMTSQGLPVFSNMPISGSGTISESSLQGFGMNGGYLIYSIGGVPEPGTWVLVLAGLAGLLGLRPKTFARFQPRAN